MRELTHKRRALYGMEALALNLDATRFVSACSMWFEWPPWRERIAEIRWRMGLPTLGLEPVFETVEENQ